MQGIYACWRPCQWGTCTGLRPWLDGDHLGWEFEQFKHGYDICIVSGFSCGMGDETSSVTRRQRCLALRGSWHILAGDLSVSKERVWPWFPLVPRYPGAGYANDRCINLYPTLRIMVGESAYNSNIWKVCLIQTQDSQNIDVNGVAFFICHLGLSLNGSSKNENVNDQVWQNGTYNICICQSVKQWILIIIKPKFHNSKFKSDTIRQQHSELISLHTDLLFAAGNVFTQNHAELLTSCWHQNNARFSLFFFYPIFCKAITTKIKAT